MSDADVAALALEIARCPEVPKARGLASHPCSKIVGLQPDDPNSFQVPEAWAGNLKEARVVFLSSNPSISEDGADHGGDSPENYPRAAWPDAKIVDFMTRRFAAEPGYVVEDRFLCQDGKYSPQSVRFWSSVRGLAKELLGHEADPDRDYVMTEVVHCKSKKEVGVNRAAAHCANRYLERLLALTDARIVVILGGKARDQLRGMLPLSPTFGTQSAVGNERANIAICTAGGFERVFCHLWHPTSMTNAPRDFPGSYPTLLPTLRAIARREQSVNVLKA